ncbi:6-hydroxymethylpterin diphosphokinase MptE-like protein [Pseudoalteromonas byunsanensis]|uniref:Septum formation inhibitor Maf n=1 Tax=Pseudoalteromonas byunsanensis TaxID=327939 RepID=A0A1S1N7Z9_9GAMM|nr:6-hydroxymethylpterin diphosphokinase MptE-like protein [Pseudoalteromonas byunsanensis]OHU95776.1 septum formation inhibitor Maf [Pseudoalteromonas byunsanensis]
MKQDSLEKQIEALDQRLSETVEHQQREAMFAEEANVRFEKNVKCFEKYYPDIAKAVNAYQVREDFCLHVTKSGHGNFIPTGESSLLYSQDPIAQTKEQIKAQTESPVFSLTDYTNYPQKEDGRIHTRYMTKLTQFMGQVKGEANKTLATLPDTFPTAIIFGLGLGYHVPLLMANTQFDYVFLIEPDFEQFFASLFCTNWYEVITDIDEQGGCLFFHLGADHQSFIKDVEKIGEDIGAFSLVRSFCYQHTPGAEVNTLIKRWCADYFRFQFGHGFYNDAITGLAHSIHHVRNKAAILVNETKKIDYDTPIFVIGNGPSLDEAEEFIKNNCDKALIVSAGTSIASLYKKGIQADFHVLVERPFQNYQIFGEILPESEYKKVNLLGLNMLYPDTNFRYKWAGVAVKGNEAGTSLMDLMSLKLLSKTLPKIPYCNPVVANTALSYFLFMGYRNIYLFGVDNGKAEHGNHHSKDSIYKVCNDDDSQGYKATVIQGKKLPGNFGGEVVSNDLYMVAHTQLEKLVSHYNVSTVMNVGSGAKITNTISTHAEDLLDLPAPLDKNRVIESIKESFFQQLPVDDIDEQYKAIEKFNALCDNIISIAREEVTSRQQAASNLKRQQRYVYAYRDTALGHLFHLIKGSLLYYHCPLLTLLYSYEDEQLTLEKFATLNQLWIDYVTDIKNDYAVNVETKCDWVIA